jgi:hypothetical protein
MSQPAVEQILGRLLTDAVFRRGFYVDPAGACHREALEVTPVELSALTALDPLRLQMFAKSLDARIVRAASGGAHYWSAWAAQRQTPHDKPRTIRGQSRRRLAGKGL